MKVEPLWHRATRILVGVLLVGQTLLSLGFAVFLLVFIPLLGGMAMAFGGSKATDDQIEKTWWMIGFMTAIPFVLTILLAVASILIILDKGTAWVYAFCTFFIIAYLVLAHVIMHGEWCGFIWQAAMPLIIPLSGIALVGNYREKKIVAPLANQ